jgi:very-short-patch-repair endonuclease
MIKYDLTNYLGRVKRLKGIPGTSKYTQILRYGRYYADIMNNQSKSKTSHFKNKIDYWLDVGYNQEQAHIQVKRVQTDRAILAGNKLRGTSIYSVRSTQYWINNGYTQKEAQEQVTRIQTTNGIAFYKKKYPDNYKEEFANRIDKWQYSLSKLDQQELNFKKGHSIEANIYRGLSYSAAVEKYDKMCNHMALIRRLPSKISQKMAAMLETNIGGTCFYDTKQYEYLINKYRVDFYHMQSKTVVEFYGDYYHQNPMKFNNDSIVHGVTAQDRWDYDAQRQSIIEASSKVNKFLIVWESEFRSDPDKTIQYIRNEINDISRKDNFS